MHWYSLTFDIVFIFGQLQHQFIYKEFIDIRIVCGVRPQTHTESLCKAWNILNVDQIMDNSIALFMYQLTNCMLPSMFENMFIQTSDVHKYSRRQADLFYIQFASTKEHKEL